MSFKTFFKLKTFICVLGIKLCRNAQQCPEKAQRSQTDPVRSPVTWAGPFHPHDSPRVMGGQALAKILLSAGTNLT